MLLGARGAGQVRNVGIFLGADVMKMNGGENGLIFQKVEMSEEEFSIILDGGNGAFDAWKAGGGRF